MATKSKPSYYWAYNRIETPKIISLISFYSDQLNSQGQKKVLAAKKAKIRIISTMTNIL